MLKTKIGGATFEHQENMIGSVDITVGNATVKVSFEALEKLVIERVRLRKIEQLQKAKPAEILGLD